MTPAHLLLLHPRSLGDDDRHVEERTFSLLEPNKKKEQNQITFFPPAHFGVDDVICPYLPTRTCPLDTLFTNVPRRQCLISMLLISLKEAVFVHIGVFETKEGSTFF